MTDMDSLEPKIKFTVFTPTYNRANLINRVYMSLMRQTFRDFEWLIIDDGSTDNTEEVVSKFVRESDFDIRYYKQKNKGKVSAINSALELAHGELFLVFDSDDWADDDALEVFNSEWDMLTDDERTQYGAISCLKRYESGEIVGEGYGRLSKKGASYIDRFNKRVKGDKWELIRTDVYRKYPYPVQQGERYMAPEYSWLLIGMEFKTIFLDRSLSVIEYQEDGISKNNIFHRVASPGNACLYYSLARDVSGEGAIWLRSVINQIRFLIHAGESVPSRDWWLLPLGGVFYLWDRVKMSSRRAR